MQFNWPIVGHKNIVQYFSKALAVGKVHHAYLFQGPAQVGKSTFARMLAKTLLCEGSERSPCGVCRSCTAFDHGAHPDFLALDRGDAAHLSIENAREFIAALSTRPLLGPIRIGMIEEASRLTLEAANALLKTLEEPGASVVLFLIADRPPLPTIASRCQIIKFGFASALEIEKNLAGTPHASEIAYLAGGRPGRALMLRDPELYKEYTQETHGVLKILEQDEGGRLLWASERFGRSLPLPDRRELFQRWLEAFQAVLRDCMFVQHGVFGALPHAFAKDEILKCAGGIAPITLVRMLGRARLARDFLEANVDPRLICEYLLLSP